MRQSGGASVMTTMLGERIDRNERLQLADALPVGKQLVLVQLRPLAHQAHRARRQRAGQERPVDRKREAACSPYSAWKCATGWLCSRQNMAMVIP